MQKLLNCLCVLLLLGCARAQSRSCESLGQLELPQATITSAETIAAGALPVPANLPPVMGDLAPLFKSLPAFCRVTVRSKPSADSDIKIEVWMPAAGWNGRFRGQGNGGFAGLIAPNVLATALRQGYATAGTDTGHSASGIDARWALGHPEKVTDFGYRGIHEMTQIAKAVIAAFYGSKARYSYFGACSNGGRQALMEAQRFPEDYDGILAGAPANFWTHLLADGVWNAQVTAKDAASYIPSSKLPAIAAAVNAKCDAQDGVADGILNDPRQCRFDAAAMLCTNGDSDQCLTAPQVTALNQLYEGAHDKSGQIFPGFVPGAEEGPGGWSLWITGAAPGKALLFAFANGFFSNMVYEKPDWDFRSANLTEATRVADSKAASTLNAVNPNLEPFRARGGKLILYHGWNDPAIPALNTIDYYSSVVKQMGKQNTDSFLRLYMVPGMQHCGDGPGTDSFGQHGDHASQDPQHNVLLALENWVEKNDAPSKIIATKYGSGPQSSEMKMTRPLCPYPGSARYNGNGDPNKAESFSCSAAGK